MAANYKKQVGVIPYIIEKKGKFSFILITPQSSKNYWIFPKGNIETKLGEKGSALDEAYEEAGLTGKISYDPKLYYNYEKYGRQYKVKFFLMKVKNIFEEWEEDDIRERRIVKPKKAESLLSDDSLKTLLKKALKIIKKNEL